jgi:hypothetical protein
MAHYGQLLDELYNPSKEHLYPLFVKYFNNPIMTKIKDINGYSMYMSKINSLLLIEFRYIIVFTMQDTQSIGSTEPLSSLKWITLQTRSLKDDHKLPLHYYTPSRMSELNKPITQVKNSSEPYTYDVQNYPILITLIPKEKNSHGAEYKATGNVITALETFSTIVSFK